MRPRPSQGPSVFSLPAHSDHPTGHPELLAALSSGLGHQPSRPVLPATMRAEPAQQMSQAPRESANFPERVYFIAGSDARIIVGDDVVALRLLWQRKRGEGEPEDLPRNLIVRGRHRGAEPPLVRGQQRTGPHGRPEARPACWSPLDGSDSQRPGGVERGGVRGQVHAPLVVLGRGGRQKKMPKLRHNMGWWRLGRWQMGGDRDPRRRMPSRRSVTV